MDDQNHRHATLSRLAEADRAYRAAFEQLTSVGGLDPSSFDRLVASVERLREVVSHLPDDE